MSLNQQLASHKPPNTTSATLQQSRAAGWHTQTSMMMMMMELHIRTQATSKPQAADPLVPLLAAVALHQSCLLSLLHTDQIGCLLAHIHSIYLQGTPLATHHCAGGVRHRSHSPPGTTYTRQTGTGGHQETRESVSQSVFVTKRPRGAQPTPC